MFFPALKYIVLLLEPSKILNNLNSIVKRVNFGRLRMSLSVAKINNGSIELSSAAMPPTYYYNAKKDSVEEILVPNLPLGGIEGEKFDGVKKDFKKGDVVVYHERSLCPPLFKELGINEGISF